MRFPVTTAQFSSAILGRETHFVLCAYDDHIMVVATQIGRMGTLLEASKEEGHGGVAIFNVNVLMGKRDEPMLVACARQLIEIMSDAGSSRPLILSLGLKDHSRDTMKKIVELVVANKIW